MCMIMEPRGAVLNINMLSGEAGGAWLARSIPGGEAGAGSPVGAGRRDVPSGRRRLAGVGGAAGPARGTQPAQGSVGGSAPCPPPSTASQRDLCPSFGAPLPPPASLCIPRPPIRLRFVVKQTSRYWNSCCCPEDSQALGRFCGACGRRCVPLLGTRHT